MTHPIDNVTWLRSDTLKGNAWNPNAVLMDELRLLELSIIRLGWVQPILVNKSLIVIDGFHRWRLSLDSREIKARDGGIVPCAILDVPDDEAMLMTVRMNRAKGTHVAVRMSTLVQTLVNQYGYDPEQVATEIGASRLEIDTLLQENLFSARDLGKYRYGRAWVPIDK